MADAREGDAPYHLAQVNIARMRASLTDPVMAGFVVRLDEINALADAAEGFVWRLQADPESEQQAVAFENDGMLFNLSLWRSVETLRAFVYNSIHRELIASRTDWFEKMDGPHMALWWVPAGHQPGVDEALLRLDRLELLGPSQNAFTFAQHFPMPQRPGPDNDEQEEVA